MNANVTAAATNDLNNTGGQIIAADSLIASGRHPEHHALHDARAYRLGWLAWMDTRKSMPC